MVWRIWDTRDRFGTVGRFGVEADLKERGRYWHGNALRIQQQQPKKKRKDAEGGE